MILDLGEHAEELITRCTHMTRLRSGSGVRNRYRPGKYADDLSSLHGECAVDYVSQAAPILRKVSAGREHNPRIPDGERGARMSMHGELPTRMKGSALHGSVCDQAGCLCVFATEGTARPAFLKSRPHRSTAAVGTTPARDIGPAAWSGLTPQVGCRRGRGVRWELAGVDPGEPGDVVPDSRDGAGVVTGG